MTLRSSKLEQVLADLGDWHRRNLWGMRGTDTPIFWTKGYRTPTFQEEKVKNLLLPAVNRSDLLRLNHNKTVFGLGSTRTPLGRWESS